MNVITLPHAVRATVLPMVLFVDMQREYVSVNRNKFVSTATSAIDECVKLLALARELKIPIAHFRQILQGYDFNRASEYSQWIEALRPRPNEYVYERSLPSCFANPAFDELVRNVDKPEIIVAGLGAERACLSTIIEGYHRGYQMTFIDDCSACGMAGSMTELETQLAVRNVLSAYCEVVTLEVARLRLESRIRWQVGH